MKRGSGCRKVMTLKLPLQENRQCRALGEISNAVLFWTRRAKYCRRQGSESAIIFSRAPDEKIKMAPSRREAVTKRLQHLG